MFYSHCPHCGSNERIDAPPASGVTTCGSCGKQHLLPLDKLDRATRQTVIRALRSVNKPEHADLKQAKKAHEQELWSKLSMILPWPFSLIAAFPGLVRVLSLLVVAAPVFFASFLAVYVVAPDTMKPIVMRVVEDARDIQGYWESGEDSATFKTTVQFWISDAHEPAQIGQLNAWLAIELGGWSRWAVEGQDRSSQLENPGEPSSGYLYQVSILESVEKTPADIQAQIEALLGPKTIYMVPR